MTNRRKNVEEREVGKTLSGQDSTRQFSSIKILAKMLPKVLLINTMQKAIES